MAFDQTGAFVSCSGFPRAPREKPLALCFSSFSPFWATLRRHLIWQEAAEILLYLD